ncbi:MAG: hypothetical protein JST68_27405 [Bacteroidetes bacterium]|nr:hypothetical protein [Bacteroidota bacterium]
MEPNTARWGFPKRIAILFLTVYCFFLFFDFTSSDEIFPPLFYKVMKPYIAFWDWFVMWTGKHLLNLPPITVKPNGSGDTTYNYVMQLLWVVLALVAALTWAVLDKKRPAYNQLYRWLRICIRYYFAYTLFTYGFVKVIKLQFPYPSLYKLADPFGNSSPMGLAWSFIGYSKGYNWFIGGAECLAGALLFFRRTTFIGALLAFIIMANVAVMNLCYDIPVKVFSLNLVFLSIILLAHDYDRIKAMLIKQRAIQINQRWGRILQVSLKVLFIFLAFYYTLGRAIGYLSQYGDDIAKPPLYGIYDVEQYTRKGNTADSVSWKRLIIAFPERARIVNRLDTIIRATCKVDTIHNTATFSTPKEKEYKLAYTNPDKDHLLFTGSISGDSVSILMRRYDVNKFLLNNRGFHWVNEYPMNR